MLVETLLSAADTKMLYGIALSGKQMAKQIIIIFYDVNVNFYFKKPRILYQPKLSFKSKGEIRLSQTN